MIDQIIKSVDEVQSALRQAKELETLCGEILATLHVNTEVWDQLKPEHEASWRAMIKGWDRQYKRILGVTQ